MPIDHLQELKKHIQLIVDNVQPQALIDYFKDHKALASHLFSGFRINASTIKNAIVRQRILAESERDGCFLETLCGLYLYGREELLESVTYGSANSIKQEIPELQSQFGPLAVKVALLLDTRKSVQNLARVISLDMPEVELAPDPLEPDVPSDDAASAGEESQQTIDKAAASDRAAKEKRRKYEQEVRRLENDVERLSAAGTRKDAEIKDLKTELAEQKKLISRSEKNADRQRRAVEVAQQAKAAVESELKSVRREVAQLQSEMRAQAVSRANDTAAAAPDWVAVVNKMVSSGSLDAARSFCDTLCGIEPDSIHAHLHLHRIYRAMGDAANETEQCIRISAYFGNRRQFSDSFDYIYCALELSPDDARVHAIFRQVISGADLANETMMSHIRHKLVRMKLDHRSSHRQARKVISRLGKQYERAFLESAETLHPDRMIDFSDGTVSKQLSIRGIVNAVDCNDVPLTDFIRRALSPMHEDRPELYKNLMRSVADNDQTCIEVLNNGSRTVVVDGSNAAWYECARPRLQNIFAIRNELRACGYFPIYIYADAALIHQIDHGSDLQRMIELGAVLMADGGTDADGLIIERAGSLRCPVVTNDRMLDWDPNGDIEKLQFEIGAFGAVIHD